MGVIDFTRIFRLIERGNRLTDDRLWDWGANNRDVRDEIIRLNTEDQLFQDGIDSEGFDLGEYSQFTISVKRSKGQRYDHVTLKDTGEFYQSWTVVVDRDSITIDADDEKDDKALFEVYGGNVLGLTDFNKQRIKQIILTRYIQFLRNELLQ